MIGIFDSGIGGLTVAREVMRLFPQNDICYFGDTARTPYGTKSPETVVQYAMENTRFLIEKGAHIILVACNTASSVATEPLREAFDLPIFEAITPAVAMALEDPGAERIGVIGTRATIASKAYEKKIEELAGSAKKVYSVPCPLLVPLVEEGWLKKPETRMIVKKYLHPLKTRRVDTLILGCTHYPVLKDIISKKIGKRVRVIDSSLAMAGSLKSYLNGQPDALKGLRHTGAFELFVSDVTPQFEKVAAMLLQKKISLNLVRK